MTSFKPKFITFDCYGTLIYFEMAPAARGLYADRVRPEAMGRFVRDFSNYRLDEVLHDFKPYKDVVANALIRTCKRNGVEYRDSDAETIYAAIPSWGPHPDVVEPLMRVAKEFPIVGLTNSMIDLIPAGIRSLKAPFHAVITAEETGAYKPHMQGFEYMLDKLGAKAEEVMHVSSSFRYDLMTAADMDFGARVHVDRNHEPLCSGYATHQIKDLGGLPGLLGL
ncbi:haloacid dehalogenase type II [Methylobacterium sp. SyP6R]|uniref:haloacid dehalogenase type II n=1 Tax=Methylobacterium sp. SyP6R TaxID=2718876 RepID=UPI001EFFF627|nr:haloacid dehalogenase type II [Methylobacterium sp. SyP6R]MCF4127805.1 haloacid dehalogenase type II [Methylobacterium sp. SyP6R]